MTDGMTTSRERRSATIIPFPVRGLAIGGGHRDQLKPAGQNGAPRYAMIASGGAWYHEAAMSEEADEARKR